MKKTTQFPIAVMDEKAKKNFATLMESKQELLKKAFKTAKITFRIDTTGNEDDSLVVDWVNKEDAEAMNAASKLFASMSHFAQKNIRPGKKEIKSEKFAMRTFLLSMGWIGNEYKEARKFLMKNLSGSSAFSREK